MVEVEIFLLIGKIIDKITRRRLMSTFARERLSANLPETSEIPRQQDLEAMIARLDEEWRELKECLKEWVQSDLRKESISQTYLSRLRQAVQEDTDTSETEASPPLADNKINFALSPLEAEAIIDRVEQSDQETRILERLNRVERRCRRLTMRFSLLGIFLCILLFGFMVFSTDDLRKNLGSGGNSLGQITKGIIMPQPSGKESPSLKAPNQERPPARGEPATSPSSQKRADQASVQEHASLTTLSREPILFPAAPDISLQSASQESKALTNNLKAPAMPPVKYVGSITSNKYHYPHCRWAKTIIPRKVRGFHSVEEAQKAGYIRCPVCQPPLTDNPE